MISPNINQSINKSISRNPFKTNLGYLGFFFKKEKERKGKKDISNLIINLVIEQLLVINPDRGYWGCDSLMAYVSEYFPLFP